MKSSNHTRIKLITTALLVITAILSGIQVQAQESKGIKSHKGDNGDLWGYVNNNDSTMYPWFARANRVTFGFMGIGGGSKNDMLNHGYNTEWVISPQYDDVAKEFHEGLAAIVLHGRVGYIDTLNHIVIEPQFDEMKNLDGFSHGLAAVKLNGKYGFINKKGEFVLKPEYDYADNFRTNHLATIKSGNKFGAIDLNGEVVVPCKFVAEEAMIYMPVTNKLYRQAQEKVAQDFIDGKYSTVMNTVKSAANDVEQQLKNNNFRLRNHQKGEIKSQNGAKGYYLADGRCLLSPIYDDIVAQPNGILLLYKGEKWGMADDYGRIIIDPRFDIVEYDPRERLFIVDYGGSVGLYSESGRMILPPCLDGLDNFINGKAIAYINNENGLVDTRGNISADIIDKAFLKAAQADDAGADNKTILPLYEQVLLAQPDYAMAHNNIGIMQIESESYKEGMGRLKVAHKLSPENKEISDNLNQAKKDRKQRRWNRISTAIDVITAVGTAALSTYATVETIKHGSSANTSGFSSFSGSSGSSSGSSGDCGQILSELNRYQTKLKNETDNVDTKSARAAGKNAAHRISPESVDGATYGDYRVINSGKSLSRTYERRVTELQSKARSKGCL
jgi:hypothetical protein